MWSQHLQFIFQAQEGDKDQRWTAALQFFDCKSIPEEFDLF